MPKKVLPSIYPYDRDNFNPPAPVLEISLTVPNSLFSKNYIKSIALLDTGADITATPQWIVEQLQLKYVDEILASGYDGPPKKVFVYSVKIIFDNLEDFVIRTIPTDKKYVMIGRNILNKWSLLLKGRDNIFEIS